MVKLKCLYSILLLLVFVQADRDSLDEKESSAKGESSIQNESFTQNESLARDESITQDKSLAKESVANNKPATEENVDSQQESFRPFIIGYKNGFVIIVPDKPGVQTVSVIGSVKRGIFGRRKMVTGVSKKDKGNWGLFVPIRPGERMEYILMIIRHDKMYVYKGKEDRGSRYIYHNR